MCKRRAERLCGPICTLCASLTFACVCCSSVAHSIRRVSLNPALWAGSDSTKTVVTAPAAAAAANEEVAALAAQVQQLTAANTQLTAQVQQLTAGNTQLTAQVQRLTAAVTAAESGPLNAELKSRAPREWSARAVVQWLKCTAPVDANPKLDALRAELLLRAESGAANALDGAGLLALDVEVLSDAFGVSDAKACVEVLKAVKPLKDADAKAKAALSQPLQELAAAQQQLRFQSAQIAHNAAVAKMAAEYIALLERQLPPPSTGAASAAGGGGGGGGVSNPKLLGLLSAIASGVTAANAKLDVAVDTATAAAASAAVAAAAV